jgi:small-conductance mechanosensitive channel
MLRRDYPPAGPYGWPPPTIREMQARWLRWACLAVAALAVLALVAFVISHDDPRQPGLSDRAWLTLGLAALLLVALSVHHYAGGARRLLRALAEYAVVALLAVLLTVTALPAANQPAAQQSATKQPAQQPAAQDPADPRAKGAGDGCPPVRRVPAWLACLWRQANPPQPTDSPTPPARRTP